MLCKTLGLKGASGKVYSFHACALDLALNDVGAVYALTKRTTFDNGKDFFEIVYLGQTDKLGRAVAKHREGLWALEHECNSVCVHHEEDGVKRIKKIDDLARQYSPKVASYGAIEGRSSLQ
jgi:hypothetical protein